MTMKRAMTGTRIRRRHKRKTRPRTRTGQGKRQGHGGFVLLLKKEDNNDHCASLFQMEKYKNIDPEKDKGRDKDMARKDERTLLGVCFVGGKAELFDSLVPNKDKSQRIVKERTEREVKPLRLSVQKHP